MENIEERDTELSRFLNNWWLFLLAGMLLIACGFWVGTNTNSNFKDLTTLFVFLYLVNGALEIIFATRNRVIPGWGGLLVLGIFEFVLGLLLLISPPTHVHVLIGYVALWLLSRGMLLFLVAIDLEALGASPGWAIYLVGGFVAVGLGLVIFVQPNVSFGSLVVWTAMGMIATGVFFILYSLHARKGTFRIEEVRQKLRNMDSVPH